MCPRRCAAGGLLAGRRGARGGVRLVRAARAASPAPGVRRGGHPLA